MSYSDIDRLDAIPYNISITCEGGYLSTVVGSNHRPPEVVARW